MRIVKKGRDPRTKPLHGKCTNCQTEIEFTSNEGTFHPGDPGDQRERDWYGFPCPVCGAEIYGRETA